MLTTMIERFKEKLGALNRFHKNVWNDNPWLRASGILAATIASVLSVHRILPKTFSLINKIEESSEFQLFFLVGLVVLYFFLVAIFSGDRLRFEKKLRECEQNFHYDHRGTLYNSSQPNIAFRVATFKEFLHALAVSVGPDNLKTVLADVGKIASHDFSEQLSGIYNKDVLKSKGGILWDDLSFSEKITEWADYDSSTGWGILTAVVEGTRIRVTFTHYQGLFEDLQGKMFGHFLSGYCQTVLGNIVKAYPTGKIGEYQGVELDKTDFDDKYTLRMEYVFI